MRKKSIIKKPLTTENFGRKKVSAKTRDEARAQETAAENRPDAIEETPKELTYEIGDVVYEMETEVWNEPDAGAPELETVVNDEPEITELSLETRPADSNAILLSDAGEQAIETMENSMQTESPLRVLTDDEEKAFAECESRIENSLRSYLSAGKDFFEIHSNKYFLKEYKSFADYVSARWKFKPSGARDLIRSYRTWIMLNELPAVPEPAKLLEGDTQPVEAAELTEGGATDTTEVLTAEPVFEPLAESDAPSQRAIDELAKLKKHLSQGEMSEAEFEKWIAVATRSLFDYIRETTTGEITQDRIAEVTAALIEITNTNAVEIEGEQRKLNAGSIQITREQFESVMREKQTIFEYFEEKRRRLSEPKTRDDLDEKKIQKKTLTVICSEHGEQPIYAILHGAVQVFCGCVFGHSSKSNRMIFDKRLTATNEIAVVEREEFYNKLNQ